MNSSPSQDCEATARPLANWPRPQCSRYIKPRRPQQNGKVERSDRIDQEEFWGRNAFGSHEEAALTSWEHAYNHARFSMALAGRTPVEKLASEMPVLAAS
jgi:transposase InsO family protein